MINLNYREHNEDISKKKLLTKDFRLFSYLL